MKTLVAVLAVTAGGWLAPTAAAQMPAAQTTAASYQRDIFSATNHQRRAHDRAALRHQACVQRKAVRQARRMAAREEMFHQDLDAVLRDCDLRSAGENVAVGFDDGRSVVVDGWMQSPPHRANILRGSFRLLGTGARRGDDGRWYAVQVFGRA